MADDWFANCVSIIERDIQDRKKRIKEYEQKIKDCEDPKERETLITLMNITKETMLALEAKMPEAKSLL